MSYINKRDCEHGRKRGSCNTCDLEQEIAGLKAQIEQLKKQGDIINNNLWDLIRGAVTKISCIDACQPWISLVSKTPEQCLNQIKAKTIRHCITQFSVTDFDIKVRVHIVYIADLEAYANELEGK